MESWRMCANECFKMRMGRCFMWNGSDIYANAKWFWTFSWFILRNGEHQIPRLFPYLNYHKSVLYISRYPRDHAHKIPWSPPDFTWAFWFDLLALNKTWLPFHPCLHKSRNKWISLWTSERTKSSERQCLH